MSRLIIMFLLVWFFTGTLTAEDRLGPAYAQPRDPAANLKALRERPFAKQRKAYHAVIWETLQSEDTKVVEVGIDEIKQHCGCTECRLMLERLSTDSRIPGTVQDAKIIGKLKYNAKVLIVQTRQWLDLRYEYETRPEGEDEELALAFPFSRRREPGTVEPPLNQRKEQANYLLSEYWSNEDALSEWIVKKLAFVRLPRTRDFLNAILTVRERDLEKEYDLNLKIHVEWIRAAIMVSEVLQNDDDYLASVGKCVLLDDEKAASMAIGDLNELQDEFEKECVGKDHLVAIGRLRSSLVNELQTKADKANDHERAFCLLTRAYAVRRTEPPLGYEKNRAKDLWKSLLQDAE